MMGKRSSPFVSRIAILLLICAELVCFSASQSTTCNMPSVEEGQTAALTCEFGFDMQEVGQRRDVIIKRVRTTSSKPEELLECYWDLTTDDYRCKVKNPRFSFNSHITDHVTLRLLKATQEDEGQYYCDVTSQRAASCNFSVEAKTEPKTTCTMPSVEEGQTAEFTCFLPPTLKGELPSDVFIRRKTGGTNSTPEEIGECVKKNGAFTCTEKHVKAKVHYTNTQVSLLLLNGKKEDAGDYYCEAPGATPVYCDFTVWSKTTCTMPSLEEGLTAEFTCNLPPTMESDLPDNLFIKRERGLTGGPEEIGECFKKNGTFTCKEKLNETSISHTNTQVSLHLSHAKKEDAGDYYCENPDATPLPCNLKISTQTTSTMPSVEEGQTAVFTCFLPLTMDSGMPSAVLIMRKIGGTDSTPDKIGECSQKNGNFKCKTIIDKISMSYTNTQVNLLLSNAKKEDEGEYYCDAPGTTHVPCHFTVNKIPPPTYTAAIVLGVLLGVVLCAVAGGVLYHWKKYHCNEPRQTGTALGETVRLRQPDGEQGNPEEKAMEAGGVCV